MEWNVSAGGQKNLNDGASRPRKEFEDIFSYVDKYTNVTYEQTDGQTPDDSIDCTYA